MKTNCCSLYMLLSLGLQNFMGQHTFHDLIEPTTVLLHKCHMDNIYSNNLACQSNEE